MTAARFTKEELRELGFEEDEHGNWRSKRPTYIQRNDPAALSESQPMLLGKAKKAHGAHKEAAGCSEGGGRYRIVVTAYHYKHTDPDNLAAKWYIDQLIGCVIPDDSSEFLAEVAKRVVKIEKPEKQRTVLEVYQL